jgi:hypothetical protein
MLECLGRLFTLARQMAPHFFAPNWYSCPARSLATDASSHLTLTLSPGQVAAVMKKGGLMSHSSNPGAATPQSLHKMYKDKAAMTGNPFLLRQFATPHNLALRNGTGAAARDGRNLSYLNQQPQRRRSDSPPRATFRIVSDNGYAQISSAYLR